MKASFTPVAAAVGLALASVSAHAQLPAPALGSAAPPNNGLYLAVWDTASNNSEIVNLGYTESQLTIASGNLTPNSATSPYSTAVDPATGTGSVLQLNFGTMPDFSSLFTAANVGTSDFIVMDAATSGVNETVQVTSPALPLATLAAMPKIIGNIQGEIASWAGDATVANSGFAQDTTGTTTWSVQTGELAGGELSPGQEFGQSVGSAAGFYEMAGNSATHAFTKTPYANSTGDGFWYLSTTGDLTWNVPIPSAIPLPAAVWLFGSGLLGLIGIGRRKIDATA